MEVEKVFLRKCKKKCVRRDLHDIQKERQSVVQNVFQAKIIYDKMLRKDLILIVIPLVLKLPPIY